MLTYLPNKQPPQSFQPPLPTPPSSSIPSTSTPTRPTPKSPDLITRYNLKSKLVDDADSEQAAVTITPEEEKKQGQAWSQNKGERQALLQRRREEMILAARRKMEAKVASEAALGNPGL